MVVARIGLRFVNSLFMTYKAKGLLFTAGLCF
jgi:hypothetical protein